MLSRPCAYILTVSVFICILQSTKQNLLESHPVQGKFHVSKMRREVPKDAIIKFPSDTIDCITANRSKHEVYPERFASSPCPQNSSFCDTADDYPVNQIKNFLKKDPKLLEHFYEDNIDHSADRFGDDDTPLCSSKIRVVYPRKAKSADNVYEFVVNDDEHKQGVKVEECIKNNAECDIIGDILPLGYKSHCVQKYVTRTLVVAQSNSGSISGIVTKPFNIPSCCSCSLIINQHSMANRFGLNSPESSTHKNVTNVKNLKT